MAEEESYWVKREKENIKLEQMKDAEVAEKLKDIIDHAKGEVEKEINSFYSKYASKNEITPSEAKKRVSEFDITKYEKFAKRFVREKNFSDKANEILMTYNTKMRINRQELLMMYLNAHLASMADEAVKTFQEYLEEAGISEVARQAGILGIDLSITTATLKSLVGASFYDATFSERIWKDMVGLRTELNTAINSAVIRGAHPNKYVKNLRERFDVTTFEARRLLITETARVQTGAQQLSYEALTEGEDDAEYEFIAIMDDDTSEMCEGLNGKKFKVKDMMPGINASPMHPWCRSSSALLTPDNWREAFFARTKGKYSF